MSEDNDIRAVCVICGTELEAVRPGKYQHPGDTELLCRIIEKLTEKTAARWPKERP